MKRIRTTLKSLSALLALFFLTNCGGTLAGNGVVPDTTMLRLLCPPGKRPVHRLGRGDLSARFGG